MKNTLCLLLALAGAALVPGLAAATPYFQTPLSLSAVQFESGAALDAHGGAPEMIVLGALAWHQPAAPSLLDPSWSPLSIGGAGTTWDSLHLDVGPSVNLAPQALNLLSEAINFFAPGQFENLQSAIGQGQKSQADAGLCLSPLWEVVPTQNWKGYYKTFLGGWLKFGS